MTCMGADDALAATELQQSVPICCGVRHGRAGRARVLLPHDGAVIVAVTVVRMVQMAGDDVVDMAGVRDGIVPAATTMPMPAVVRAAGVGWRARSRVRRVGIEGALVDVPCVRTVQVTIVEIVHVVPVADAGMSAAAAVRVGVIAVRVVARHERSLSPRATPHQPESLAPARRIFRPQEVAISRNVPDRLAQKLTGKAHRQRKCPWDARAGSRSDVVIRRRRSSQLGRPRTVREAAPHAPLS